MDGMVRNNKGHFFVPPKPNAEGLGTYDTVAVRFGDKGKLFEIESFDADSDMVTMTSGDSFPSMECWRLWL